MKCEAIIFDLDGTLLDTLDDLADANNQALSELGFPTHPVEDYKHHIGNGVRLLLERTLPENARDEATVETGMAMMKQAYEKCWDNKTHAYDGIAELLDELVRRGVRMAILSNKPHVYTRMIVDKLLADWQFEEVWGVSDTVAPKPDTAGVFGLAGKMGLAPEDFLYLGDTATDMETANAADMFAIGVLWGFRTADELTRSGAKVLLSAGFGADRFNHVSDGASLRAVAELTALGGFLGVASLEPGTPAVETYATALEHFYARQTFGSVLAGATVSAERGWYGSEDVPPILGSACPPVRCSGGRPWPCCGASTSTWSHAARTSPPGSASARP